MAQREHKFRGRRKDDGQWVYGNLIVNPPYEIPGLCKPQPLYNFIQEQEIKWNQQERCWRFEVYDVDPDTVGEYTGLKDKNGKEIWENSFVKDTQKISQVVWNENEGAWWLKEFDVPLGSLVYGNVQSYDPKTGRPYWTDLEVIGNIHENPELLEKDNETD